MTRPAVSRTVFDIALYEWEEVTRQRDELVAALASLEFAASAALGLTGGNPPETKVGIAIKQARAALAKVQL